MTSYGIHRDDYDFIHNDMNSKDYSSQGLQKLIVLAMKLSEVKIFVEQYKIIPVLLLDDLFSELDEKNRNNIFKSLDKNIQIFITTTDLKKIKKTYLKNSKIFKLSRLNREYNGVEFQEIGILNKSFPFTTSSNGYIYNPKTGNLLLGNFDPENLPNNINSKQIIKEEEEYSEGKIVLKQPTRPGYVFTGWTTYGASVNNDVITINYWNDENIYNSIYNWIIKYNFFCHF